VENKIFKPKIDKLFWILCIPTNILLLGAVIIPPFFSLTVLFISLPVFLFTNYFFVSPLFGYVELRQEDMLIKYGFFLKRVIPYSRIRRIRKERKFYSETMLSLKSAMEHVEIRYNSFDVTVVSVKDNDALIAELDERRGM